MIHVACFLSFSLFAYHLEYFDAARLETHFMPLLSLSLVLSLNLCFLLFLQFFNIDIFSHLLLFLSFFYMF